eukprot:747306-Rhodomonas_salina.1
MSTAVRETCLRMPEQNDVSDYVPAFVSVDGVSVRRERVSDKIYQGMFKFESFVDTIITYSNTNSMAPII